MSNLANYSPEDVYMVISNDIFGTHTISGTAEGTFISYERSVDRATLVTGSDLFSTRVLRRNKAGTVTVTLMQESSSNDILSAIALRDEESHNNSYLFSVTIKDTSGRSVFFAPEAFIGNDPQVTYSSDTETREWTITVTSIERNFGGNARVNAENEATLAALGVTLDPQWVSN